MTAPKVLVLKMVPPYKDRADDAAIVKKAAQNRAAALRQERKTRKVVEGNRAGYVFTFAGLWAMTLTLGYDADAFFPTEAEAETALRAALRHPACPMWVTP